MAKTAVSWRLGAVAALVAGCAWCAHAALEESVWADVSFYSTFDNPDKGIAAERGAGAWNTENGYDGTTPVLPAFITVSGSTPALDLATYQNWTGTKVEGGVSPTQTVLGVEAETFTIAFRASAGGVPNALLFSLLHLRSFYLFGLFGRLIHFFADKHTCSNAYGRSNTCADGCSFAFTDKSSYQCSNACASCSANHSAFGGIVHFTDCPAARKH